MPEENNDDFYTTQARHVAQCRKEAWFVAPKIYLLLLKNGTYIKKFKGITQDLVSIDDYKKLHRKEKVTIEMRKWYRFNTHVETAIAKMTIDPCYWQPKRKFIAPHQPSGDVVSIPLKIN